MNRYILFKFDLSEFTHPFNVFAWIGRGLTASAFITAEGSASARRLRVFMEFIEAQGIGHHYAYEQVEWTAEFRHSPPKDYTRTIAFLCVPDPDDAVLLRLRFDCLPVPEDQDLRGPWYPMPAYATVELDD
jgi:hypothetical protein